MLPGKDFTIQTGQKDFEHDKWSNLAYLLRVIKEERTLIRMCPAWLQLLLHADDNTLVLMKRFYVRHDNVGKHFVLARHGNLWQVGMQ